MDPVFAVNAHSQCSAVDALYHPETEYERYQMPGALAAAGLVEKYVAFIRQMAHVPLGPVQLVQIQVVSLRNPPSPKNLR